MKLIAVLVEDDAPTHWVPEGALVHLSRVERQALLDRDACNILGITVFHTFRRALERGEGPALATIAPRVSHAEALRKGLLCGCDPLTVYYDHRLGLVRCHTCHRIYGPVRAGWLHRQWLRIRHALKPTPRPTTMLDIRQRLRERTAP